MNKDHTDHELHDDSTPLNDKSAFPFVSHGGIHAHQFVDAGMRLRDYFAAHAPNEPDSWFTPDRPSKPRPRPEYIADEGGNHFIDCVAASAECGDAFHAKNQTEIDEWEIEKQKLETIGWRWAYADSMLAHGYPGSTVSAQQTPSDNVRNLNPEVAAQEKGKEQ